MYIYSSNVIEYHLYRIFAVKIICCHQENQKFTVQWLRVEVIFKFDKFPSLSCSLQSGGLTPHCTQMNSQCTLFIFQRQKPWTTQMLYPYITPVTINVSWLSLCFLSFCLFLLFSCYVKVNMAINGVEVTDLKF